MAAHAFVAARTFVSLIRFWSKFVDFVELARRKGEETGNPSLSPLVGKSISILDTVRCGLGMAMFGL
ncbi:hypothetical protein Droror1_Dr00000330, partial [Drosera rotundifolia]